MSLKFLASFFKDLYAGFGDVKIKVFIAAISL